MFQFYAAGHAHATDPFEVGAVVHHAITTDSPVLRYPVSWGGRELIDSRTQLSDGAWLELGVVSDMDEYCAMFEDVMGLDIPT